MPRQPRLLPIRIYGDAILRQKAAPVESIDDELREFAADLVHTMYLRDGVGLAAPQVGVSRRVIAVDPYWSREHKPKDPLIMINPELEFGTQETETEEGCISLPQLYANVIRPASVNVSFTDLSGQRRVLAFTGYPAVVVQHEYDHLEGVLFVDRLRTLARLKLMPRLRALERRAVDGVNILQTE